MTKSRDENMQANGNDGKPKSSERSLNQNSNGQNSNGQNSDKTTENKVPKSNNPKTGISKENFAQSKTGLKTTSDKSNLLKPTKVDRPSTLSRAEPSMLTILLAGGLGGVLGLFIALIILSANVFNVAQPDKLIQDRIEKLTGDVVSLRVQFDDAKQQIEALPSLHKASLQQIQNDILSLQQQIDSTPHIQNINVSNIENRLKEFTADTTAKLSDAFKQIAALTRQFNRLENNFQPQNHSELTALKRELDRLKDQQQAMQQTTENFAKFQTQLRRLDLQSIHFEAMATRIQTLDQEFDSLEKQVNELDAEFRNGMNNRTQELVLFRQNRDALAQIELDRRIALAYTRHALEDAIQNGHAYEHLLQSAENLLLLSQSDPDFLSNLQAVSNNKLKSLPTIAEEISNQRHSIQAAVLEYQPATSPPASRNILFRLFGNANHLIQIRDLSQSKLKTASSKLLVALENAERASREHNAEALVIYLQEIKDIKHSVPVLDSRLLRWQEMAQHHLLIQTLLKKLYEAEQVAPIAKNFLPASNN